MELEGRGTARRLSDGEVKAAHLHVVTNTPATESYYRLLNLQKPRCCSCSSLFMLLLVCSYVGIACLGRDCGMHECWGI